MIIKKEKAKLKLPFWDRVLSLMRLVRHSTYTKHMDKIAREHYEKGQKSGRTDGYEQGMKAARKVIQPRIVLTKSTVKYDGKAENVYLVRSSPLVFPDYVVQRIARDLWNHEVKHGPDKSQRQLILSDNRNTMVIAGAGSGKSTALVWRVLVLHKYLKIGLDKITVFSFTRASCEDFRKKLVKTFNSHGISLTLDKANQIVRTFHSKVFQFARSGFYRRGASVFEFLDETPDKEEDIDNLSVSMELDFEAAKEPEKVGLLKACYCELYRVDDEFRGLIDELDWQMLLHRKLRAGGTAKQRERAKEHIKKVEGRDVALTNLCYKKMSPMGLQIPSVMPKLILSRSDPPITLHANFYMDEIKLFVFILPDKKFSQEKGWEEEKIGKGKNAISFDLACQNKVDLLLLYCGENIFFIRNEADILTLRDFVDRFKSASSLTPPLFDVHLGGEPSPVHICKAFYELAEFIESLGIEVEDVGQHVTNFSKMSEVDRLFVRALVIFWPFFDQFLSDRTIFRFSNFFKAFSDHTSQNYDKLSESMVESMSHILIDEFQDISPLEVKWIEAVFHRLHGENTSLVRVGDDYQSIYGWRGSSPEFILDRHTCFRSADPLVIEMNKNYRSYQDIVDKAELVLEHVLNRHEKSGECEKGHGGDGVNIISELDMDNLDVVVDRIIELEKKYSRSFDRPIREQRLKGKEHYVLVLSRTNKVNAQVQRLFRHKLGGKKNMGTGFYTFHKSKGLEAEYAILLEDCSYNETNEIKNMLYRLAGVSKQSYDESQRDEAMRLAYVAVTRAKIGVYWYGKPKDGGAMTLIESVKTTSGQHSGQVPLF